MAEQLTSSAETTSPSSFGITETRMTTSETTRCSPSPSGRGWQQLRPRTHYATPQRYQLARDVAGQARRDLASMDGWLPASPAHLKCGEQHRRFQAYPEWSPGQPTFARDLAFDLSLVAPQLPDFPCSLGRSPRRVTYASSLNKVHNASTGHANENEFPARGNRSTMNSPSSSSWTSPATSSSCVGHHCNSPGTPTSSARSRPGCELGSVLLPRDHQLRPRRSRAIVRAVPFPARDGPPDIDIDIESGRREEVIQYVYQRHGRHPRGPGGNVNTYRPRSAIP